MVKIKNITISNKVVIAIAITIVIIIGGLYGYKYYDTNVVKTSPEYTLSLLEQQVNSGNKEVLKRIKLYEIIGTIVKEVQLQNRSVADWNPSYLEHLEKNKETEVHLAVDDVSHNLMTMKRLQFTNKSIDNPTFRALRQLEFSYLAFESAKLSVENNHMVIEVKLYDNRNLDIVKKIDANYLFKFKFVQENHTWVVSELINGDIMIKKRIKDVQQINEFENEKVRSDIEKVLQVQPAQLTIEDRTISLTEKEKQSLSENEQKEKGKKKTLLHISIPYVKDKMVLSANGRVEFINMSNQNIVRTMPLHTHFAEHPKFMKIDEMVDYKDKSQELLLSLIEKGEITTRIVITSVATATANYFIKEIEK